MSTPQAAYVPPPPLEGAARVWGTIALSAATFMNVLDSSIANVSLPAISGDLGVSPTQGTWVITSFGVANAIAVPLTGFMTQRFGQVRLFMASVILFIISSWLCGLAPNMTTLIALRALQGFVAGPMIPLSQTLLLSSYPRAKAGLAMAMWSMTTLVAPVMGPLLGGWITDNISWPWIFYINIPVGLMAAGITWAIYRDRESATRKVPIDAIGLALLVLWVGALQLMLDKGKELDWFHSMQIVILAVVAVVGFAFFLVWELTEKHPVVDLSLFKSKNFVLATIAFCLGYAIFFGSNLLQPLWLQTRMGYIATWAGLVAAPSGVVAVFLTPFAARLMNKIDVRWTASFSLAAFAASFWLRSLYTSDADYMALALPMLVQGVAMSTFFVSMVTLSLNGIPPQQVPSASGLSNFARLTAGSFAASLTTTIWDNDAAVHQTRLAETMPSSSPAFTQAMSQLQSLGFTAQQAAAAVTQQVTNQAYLLATVDFFRVCAWVIVALIPLIWLTGRAKAGGHVAAAD